LPFIRPLVDMLLSEIMTSEILHPAKGKRT
jgi:hypothetical protein